MQPVCKAFPPGVSLLSWVKSPAQPVLVTTPKKKNKQEKKTGLMVPIFQVMFGDETIDLTRGVPCIRFSMQVSNLIGKGSL